MAIYNFTNLLQPVNTTSGVSEYILVAPVYDFDVDGIKCPEAPFTVKGDQVKVKVPHVFLATKSFVKIICAPEKNQLNAKTIGDTGFNKFDFEYDFFVAGSYAELHEQMSNFLNTPLIVMAKDSNCSANLFYQLGCDCVFAYMKLDFSTGTTKDGVKGYSGKVTYQNGAILLYDVVGGPQLIPAD